MNIRRITYIVSSLVALSSLTNLVGYYESKAELNVKKIIFDDERNPLSLREFAREKAIEYVGKIDSRNRNLLFRLFGNFGAAIGVDEFCDENAGWLY